MNGEYILDPHFMLAHCGESSPRGVIHGHFHVCVRDWGSDFKRFDLKSDPSVFMLLMYISAFHHTLKAHGGRHQSSLFVFQHLTHCSQQIVLFCDVKEKNQEKLIW